MAAVAAMAAVVVAVMAVVAMGVAPPTSLPPGVRGPPTSTPRLTLFRCGWELGGVGVQQPHLPP
jgi:hypothetical protein